ncbi:MAG: hypothetical protein WCO51_09660 [bacterium]
MPSDISIAIKKNSRRQSGQTLIIALVVTFVLLALGLVFIGLIGRNFFVTQRYGEMIDVQYYAEAGINFSLAELLNSEEGADWRPIPANILDVNDPDYPYLKAYDPATGQGGFTRISFNNGRALIRISYNPLGNPGLSEDEKLLSRCIKIESIGFLGQINRKDPTMIAAAKQPYRLLIAYAQIGITDYVRWVTNVSKKSVPADIGAPAAAEFGIQYTDGVPGGNITTGQVGITQVYGAYDDGRGNFGASMRFNSDVKFHGDMLLRMNKANGDRLLASGRFLIGGGTPHISDETGILNPITPSSAAFNSYNGLSRDGDTGDDIAGYSRNVIRLEPPTIDRSDPATGQQRYRSMTRDSGFFYNDVNMGRLGYGRGVYVDNMRDIQTDSSTLFGGYSLRADWLRTEGDGRGTNISTGQSSGYWNGPFYEPPGASLQFFYDPKNPDPEKRAGFTITRNLSTPNDVWRNLDGSRSSNRTMTFWFRSDDPADPTFKAIYNNLTDSLQNEPVGNMPFNGVLYFEGNVRVRGVIPADRQFTVVSNSTIYIEGNLVKGKRSPTAVSHSTCALMAHDYVVLNTTQFFKPGIENTPRWIRENPSDPNEVMHARITSDIMSSVPFRWSFGETPTSDIFMFMSHAGSGQGTYINMLINSDPAQVTPYLFPLSPSLSYYYNQFFVPTFALDSSYDQWPAFQKTVFQLTPAPPQSAYLLNTDPGIDNLMLFRLDPAINSPAGKQPYFFSKFAVAPIKIRIDALIYAQTGSFFVIPGSWFNENPEDRKDALLQKGLDLAQSILWRRQNFSVAVNFDGNNIVGPDYPYFGESLPIQVLINGAITENFPPSMSEQAEWLKRWGWIPRKFGLSNVTIPASFIDSLDPLVKNLNPYYIPNIIINYDPVLATGRDKDAGMIRQDAFGRLLPSIPRLPVCPNLIYSGEAQL